MRPYTEGESAPAADADAVAWTVEYVRSDEAAGVAVSRHLSAYLDDPKGPTLCLIEAPPNSGMAPANDAHREAGGVPLVLVHFSAQPEIPVFAGYL